MNSVRTTPSGDTHKVSSDCKSAKMFDGKVSSPLRSRLLVMGTPMVEAMARRHTANEGENSSVEVYVFARLSVVVYISFRRTHTPLIRLTMIAVAWFLSWGLFHLGASYSFCVCVISRCGPRSTTPLYWYRVKTYFLSLKSRLFVVGVHNIYIHRFHPIL